MMRFVPDDNRYLYLTSEMYKLVCTSDEFSGVDVLARQSIAKGVCGEVFGMNVVRVPKSYLPEGVYFLVAHKDAVLSCRTRSRTRRCMRTRSAYPAHFIEAATTMTPMFSAQSAAAYALVATGMVLCRADIAGGRITGSGSIRYTLDGSDPRYSDSAKDYVAGTSLTAETGCKIRAVMTESGSTRPLSRRAEPAVKTESGFSALRPFPNP